MKRFSWLALAIVAVAPADAHAVIRISEWMYNGEAAEFVEITNTGDASVDMTGWSYDDSSREPDSFSLSILGTLAPGESAIITETFTAEDFHNEWGTPSSLKVAFNNTHNLGRGDEINMFDGAGALADRLTYGDEDFPGSIRTNGVSGNPANLAALGANDASLWALSSVGDAYGSFASASGDIGNPGVFQVVPEPAAMALASIGLAFAGRRRAIR
jgi:MYXO-CTERM domain-containing protein